MSLKLNTSLIASISGAILLLSPAFAAAQTLAPTLTLTTSKASMVASSNPSYANLPTISWSSANATSCTAYGTGWSGNVPLAGSQKVNPSVTTVYIMTCAGAGGTVIKSVTVSVTGSVQGASTIGSGFKHSWNNNLQVGSTHMSDVSALQTALTLDGVFSGEITGGFYSKTLAAVKLFQTKHSIPAVGIVGPQTRAKLNALYGY